MEYKIPVPLVAVIADVFSNHYTHTEIDSRFFAAGFPADVPVGNKQQKCHAWLLRANQQDEAPLLMVGRLIEELMETVPPPTLGGGESPLEAHRARISAQLSALGLCYQTGGHILQLGTSAASRTLQQIVHDRDLKGVHLEFDLIFANLESDPAAAVTASCALLEALFKTYIADEKLTLPSDQSILPLWKVVRSHLQLDPADMQDDGLKKILSGLASIVDGIASLRTKRGSAHGHDGRTSFRLEPRHARLASHGAFTLATFFIEVAETKKRRK
ncbi:abortive infection family protein [Tunturibacter empetritectus]|uniref:Abortive infection family protein n=1 Tax=Tunturiibacter empetritectus TaxID=3069691 RepID=A0AAU7ZHC7_9BACT